MDHETGKSAHRGPRRLLTSRTHSKNTAALLELTDNEVDYITSELVNTPATDVREVEPAVLGDEWEDLPGPRLGLKVVPNRITYISEIAQGWTGSRWNTMFYANCDRRTPYILWDNDINRWQRDGTCGVVVDATCTGSNSGGALSAGSRQRRRPGNVGSSARLTMTLGITCATNDS